MHILKKPAWVLIALLGALSLGMIATVRGEPLNAVWLVAAAACIYALGYRFYSRWVVFTVLELDDRRATPAERLDDGRDFLPTNKWVLFGHHFAAIAGPGPLVGPILDAQFGDSDGSKRCPDREKGNFRLTSGLCSFDQVLEFRVVMKAGEVGVAGGPIHVRVAAMLGPF